MRDHLTLIENQFPDDSPSNGWALEVLASEIVELECTPIKLAGEIEDKDIHWARQIISENVVRSITPKGYLLVRMNKELSHVLLLIKLD